MSWNQDQEVATIALVMLDVDRVTSALEASEHEPESNIKTVEVHAIAGAYIARLTRRQQRRPDEPALQFTI